MTEPLTELIPLKKDADGALRVGGTRVPLETVVVAFESGATPEEIAQDFSALRLDDIYAVITYYLRHRSEVERYLEGRQEVAEEIRRKWEARSSQAGLLERLLAEDPVQSAKGSTRGLHSRLLEERRRERGCG